MISSLVYLRHTEGPEYLFTSNNHNESELEKIKTYLSELLYYVADNPEDLDEQAFRKQVLLRILELALTEPHSTFKLWVNR